MRSEKEMLHLILRTAEEDERIRAVMMNGSRVNLHVPKDQYQDYDVVYFVSEVESFTCDHAWVDGFGKRIMMQMPDAMTLFPPDLERQGLFSYLMLFEDGNRIDLTLAPIETANELAKQDRLSIILLDKEGLIDPLPPAEDTDYLVKKPSGEELNDCANEFWWCMTNVAKGLCRKELPYAKSMMEGPVREMLLLAMSWRVGVETHFTVSIGKFGKYLQRYTSEELWEKWLKTYADGQIDHMWEALFTSCALFKEVSQNIAEQLGNPLEDEEKVLVYLKELGRQSKKAEQ